MRISRVLAIGAVLVAFACGGGDDGGSDPTGPNPPAGATNGTWTAQIGGPTWSATGTVTVSRLSNNFIGLGGSGYAGTTPYSLVLGIGNATGPGTHSFNLAAGGDGSSLVIGGTTGGWGTAFTGGSGSVTITLLTANRVVGIFSGIAVPGSGGATGNLTIASGRFDITY